MRNQAVNEVGPDDLELFPSGYPFSVCLPEEPCNEMLEGVETLPEYLVCLQNECLSLA